MIANKESLESLYNSKFKPQLSDLNAKRIEIVDRIKRYGLIFILLISVSLYLSFFYNSGVIPIVFIIFIMVIMGYFKIHPLWKSYKLEFKEKVIRKIINFIDESLSYNPSGKLSLEVFQKSGIFKTGVDSYKGDDYVYGKIGSTQVEFSEVHAEYKTTTVDSKGRTQTHWHTIFKGLLFSVDFNKHFNVKTYVLTDTAEKMFGFLGKKLQSLNFSRDDLINLENTDFEKQFVVYSADQIEARYILSPSLMERILDFKNQTKKDIQMSFVDNKLFVVVPYRKNLFEPKLFGNIVDFNHIQEYYNDLVLILDLVDTLNLNTRIWTKN